MKITALKIWLISFMLIGMHQGNAQDLIRTNPADLSDPQALFINPALLPYQNLSFNVAMKILHAGFLEGNGLGLRHFHNSISVPNPMLNNLGLGVTWQNFDSPFHTDNGIGLAVGYSVRPGFSLGFSMHGSNFHLDKDQMTEVELKDPLLANRLGKWYYSYGIGLFVRPISKVSLGLSMNNINRPSKSFDDSNNKKENRVPFVADFGVKFHVSRAIGISLFNNWQEDVHAPGVVAEALLENDAGLIRAGYVDRGLMFEGKVAIGSGFGISYRLDYPFSEINKVSYGSHQIGFGWNLKFNSDYTFNIRASEDTVRIIKEYYKIRIHKAEDRSKLFEQLDPDDWKYPEKAKKTEEIQVETDKKGGMTLDVIGGFFPHNNYLDAYKENFAQIRDHMKTTNRKLTINIFYRDAVTAERAAVIRNFLTDSLGFDQKNVILHREKNGGEISADHKQKQARNDSLRLLIEQEAALARFNDSDYIEIKTDPVESMMPNKIFFHITDAKVHRVSRWRIMIADAIGEPFHVINGFNTIESLVEWDGFQDDGTLMEPGNYYYQFQYSFDGGNTWIPKNPKRQMLTFVRVIKAKTTEISSHLTNNLSLLREVIIRLKEPINGDDEEQ